MSCADSRSDAPASRLPSGQATLPVAYTYEFVGLLRVRSSPLGMEPSTRAPLTGHAADSRHEVEPAQEIREMRHGDEDEIGWRQRRSIVSALPLTVSSESSAKRRPTPLWFLRQPESRGRLGRLVACLLDAKRFRGRPAHFTAKEPSERPGALFLGRR